MRLHTGQGGSRGAAHESRRMFLPLKDSRDGLIDLWIPHWIGPKPIINPDERLIGGCTNTCDTIGPFSWDRLPLYGGKAEDAIGTNSLRVAFSCQILARKGASRFPSGVSLFPFRRF